MRFTVGRMVRDNAPALIAEQGGQALCRPLEGRERGSALRALLSDQLRAYFARPGLDSLAELYDILDSVRDLHGITDEQVRAAIADLHASAGSYSQGLMLDSIAQPHNGTAPPAPAAPSDTEA